MEKKHIHKIDFAIIVGSLLILAGVIGYSRPLVVSPVDSYETADTSVLFSFEKASHMLIDDNPEFSSPEEIFIEDDLVVNLEPGVYYWKVKGITDSKIRKLIIESRVDLILRKNRDKYEVINAGNIRLRIDVYENETLQEEIILEVDESRNVSGSKFLGRQDEI